MIDHKTRVVRRAAKPYDIDSAKDFIDFYDNGKMENKK